MFTAIGSLFVFVVGCFLCLSEVVPELQLKYEVYSHAHFVTQSLLQCIPYSIQLLCLKGIEDVAQIHHF